MRGFKHIRHKFSVPIIIFSCIILFIAQSVNLFLDYNNLKTDQEKNTKSLLVISELAVTNPLWNYNIEDIQAIGDALFQQEQVAVVNIFDNKEKIIYSNQKEGIPYQRHKLEFFDTSVEKNNETLGYVEIIVTNHFLFNQLRSKIFVAAIQTVSTIFILWLIVLLVAKKLEKSIKQLENVTSKVAEGNLAVKIQVASNDEIGRLSQKFNDMTEQLLGMVKQINMTAYTLAAASEELTASSENSKEIVKSIEDSSDIIKLSASNQKSQIEDVQEIINHLTETSNNILEYVSNADELSAGAFQKANEGSKTVELAIHKIQEINETVTYSGQVINSLSEESKGIAQSVEAISSITDKTRILSFNAAIEANRAGTNGKGFTVVASEIKKLADQSDEIAEEIRMNVRAILNAIDEAVSTMKKVPAAMENGIVLGKEAMKDLNDILESTKSTSEIIKKIHNKSKSQVEMSQTALSKVESAAAISRESESRAEETANSIAMQHNLMNEISSASQGLAEMGEELIVSISRFNTP